jgi:hypothetical protein
MAQPSRIEEARQAVWKAGTRFLPGFDFHEDAPIPSKSTYTLARVKSRYACTRPPAERTLSGWVARKSSAPGSAVAPHTYPGNCATASRGSESLAGITRRPYQIARTELEHPEGATIDRPSARPVCLRQASFSMTASHPGRGVRRGHLDDRVPTIRISGRSGRGT